MTVRLRPHHLLCLLSYVGKGYSAAFTANYDRIAARLSGGEDVLVVAGPDDICAPLLADGRAHCRNASVVERDRAAANDVSQLLGRPVGVGTILTLDAGWLAIMRQGFRSGLVRSACTGCEWVELCTKVAADDFSHARIR